jgi:hypothetical protein
MNGFLTIGALLGAIVGLAHAVRVFRTQAARPSAGTGTAFYYAVWTVALWTIFGPYVPALWLVGAVALAVAKLRRVPEPAR